MAMVMVDTEALPFFENYFAGGLRTVRGFKANTLGPRYFTREQFEMSEAQRGEPRGDPRGGAFRIVGGAELIFPPPFFSDNNNLRVSAFIDGGGVFESASTFESDDIRYSAGALGALVIAFWPIGVERGTTAE